MHYISTEHGNATINIFGKEYSQNILILIFQGAQNQRKHLVLAEYFVYSQQMLFLHISLLLS